MPEIVPPQTQDLDRRNFDRISVESPNARVGVNPEGGYVISWTVRNSRTGHFEEVLYLGSELKRTGIPTLFPNYGEGQGVNGEDMTHGFGRSSIWTPDQAASASDRVVLRLGHEDISEEARAKFPFRFATSIEVQAAQDGSLLYSLKVQNKDQKDMPITPGLHPYWAVAQVYKSSIQTEGIQGFNAESINWDTTPPDTVYGFNGRALVKFPSRQISIEDITPGGKVIRHLVVWSQTPQKPDFNFVCFEPITAGDNAINTNPILLPAGSEWNMNLRFSSKSV